MYVLQLIHNTSFNTSTDRCPTPLFHGREPVKALDLRLSFQQEKCKQLKSIQIMCQLQDGMLQKFGENKQ